MTQEVITLIIVYLAIIYILYKLIRYFKEVRSNEESTSLCSGCKYNDNCMPNTKTGTLTKLSHTRPKGNSECPNKKVANNIF